MTRQVRRDYFVLALCVGFVGLLLCAWLRSYLPASVQTLSRDGKLLLLLSNSPVEQFDPRSPHFDDGHVLALLRDARQGDWLGFEWIAGAPLIALPGTDYVKEVRFTLIALPYWALTTIAMLLLATVFHRHRRQQLRSRNGRCLACGYDLRASAGRCPECGIPQEPAVDGMSPLVR